MKIGVSVPKVVSVFKEIRVQPEKVFEMIRLDGREMVGKYLSEIMNDEMTNFLGSARVYRSLGLIRKRLAEALGISRIRVNEIIRGKLGVTPHTAFRRSKFFGTTVDFWVGLKADVDIWDALRTQREADRRKILDRTAPPLLNGGSLVGAIRLPGRL